MSFLFTKVKVKTRGVPPDGFLEELVAWGKSALDEIFAVNAEPDDIYTHILPQLGPWTSHLHRRAAMLEVMRVHAGFESSWNWNEGVDTTNATSLAHEAGQETGIFQVSFDSQFIHHGYMRGFALNHDIANVSRFISCMKSDHQLAMEYYARLIRVNTRWAGPIARHEIDPWLSRGAVTEFQKLLS